MVAYLECSLCRKHHSGAAVASLCGCGGVLLARYPLAELRGKLARDEVLARPPGLWRIPELMPIERPDRAITLGEGNTPLLPARRLRSELGGPHVLLKDEGLNPTGSFKARGMAAAVSRAHELGVEAGVVPTAGNAGLAFAAYAAAAGMHARVIVPVATPRAFKAEVVLLGAELVEVEGSIADAGKLARRSVETEAFFNFATFAEPYRAEGKKTMGYELAYALEFELPDVIIYPTGGGTGLVGMWKAFDEMEALGWIGSARPRMIAVQASGCAPVVEAFAAGRQDTDPWPEPVTMASGLRVPAPLAGRLILQALRQSGGAAFGVGDDAIRRATLRLARTEGLLVAPEAGATLAALELLIEQGLVGTDDVVVLFITGNGARYLDALAP